MLTIFICCIRDKAEYKGKYMSDQLRSAFGFPPKVADDEGGGKEGGKDEAGKEGGSVDKGAPTPKKKGKNTVTQVL